MSLVDQLQQQQSALGGFKKQQQQTPDNLIQGVSVPVSINYNGGKLRMYLNLNPLVLSNPDALNAALAEIESVFDLDVWKGQSQQSSGFKKQSSGYQNSNYGNNNNSRWQR